MLIIDYSQYKVTVSQEEFFSKSSDHVSSKECVALQSFRGAMLPYLNMTQHDHSIDPWTLTTPIISRKFPD